MNQQPPPPPDRLLLVTHPNGFFGRLSYGWESVDVEMVSKALQEKFCVQVVSIDQLLDVRLSDSDAIIYSSSDEPSIRQYYKDVLSLVSAEARLVPGIEYLLAHENKGFQELHRRQLGLIDPHGQYLFDLEQLSTAMPFVFKKIDGAGSSGVSLVRTERDLARLRRRYFRPAMMRRLLTALRVRRLSQEAVEMYKYRHKGFFLGVAQKFIPGLAGDCKVLVFGERFYVLNRGLRKGDFKASGGGLFKFSREPNFLVLDYARDIFRKLDVPYVSLDIAKTSSGKCALIEYQAVHFGPYTLLRSPGYFRSDGSNWNFVECSSSLELAMADALTYHLTGQECATTAR